MIAKTFKGLETVLANSRKYFLERAKDMGIQIIENVHTMSPEKFENILKGCFCVWRAGRFASSARRKQSSRSELVVVSHRQPCPSPRWLMSPRLKALSKANGPKICKRLCMPLVALLQSLIKGIVVSPGAELKINIIFDLDNKEDLLCFLVAWVICKQ